MKWGVRKKASNALSKLKRDKEPPSEDVVRTTALKTRIKKSGTQALSSQELQDLVDRMNLENRYVSEVSKSKKSGVEGIVRDLAKSSVQDVVKEVAKETSKSMIKSTIEKKFGKW